MRYNILLTTAEDIIDVVDAVLAKPNNCNKQYISDFTELTQVQLENAINMSIELKLINFNSSNSIYNSNNSLARLLVSTSNDNQKAAIMRIILEQYPPYIDFKSRFIFTESVDKASSQIKALYNINSSSRNIKNTLVSLSTYAKALSSQGANLYILNEDCLTYIDLINQSILTKESNETSLISLLGEETYTYIDNENVLKPLLDSYSRISNINNDVRATIVYAGNAFESFLVQVANDNRISLQGKSGIISKAQALNQLLSKKHRGMINYIGQVRNATEHGVDADENGKSWEVSNETSLLFPIIVATTIKNIVLRNKTGKIIV